MSSGSARGVVQRAAPRRGDLPKQLAPSDPVLLEAAIEGSDIVEIGSWCSLWTDLIQVGQTLLTRTELPEGPQNSFVRRALWEAAVIAYGRTVKTGRRQVLLKDLVSELGPEAERCHEAALHWRDKHVAHAVAPSREKVVVTRDPDRRERLGVRVRVSPTTGPEEGDAQFAAEFDGYVYLLRNRVWKARIAPLKQQIIAEYADQIATLNFAPPAAHTEHWLTIAIDA